MAARRRRPPAPLCAFCDRTLAEIGGRRVSWSTFAGVVVRSSTDSIGTIPGRVLVEPLARPYRGTLLVLWPPDSQAMDRAVKQWSAGLRPWACQVCAQRVCDRCGSPENHPFGVDLLDHDGRRLHVPRLPGPAGCVRDGCPGPTRTSPE